MPRIGQILISLGATTENNVARALGMQGFAGGRLGTLLLERGSVTEDDLGEALAQQHGRPYAPWSVLGEVPPDVIASLPAKFAIRHAAIAYERGEDYLRIALRDPGDLRIVDELFFVTGRKILPAVAPEVRIYHALEKYYGERRTPRYAILGEKLSRPARSPTKSAGPPPPPDFFPSGHAPVPPPQPHEVWGDAAETEVAEPPIIQKWRIPDEPAAPWAVAPAKAGKAAAEPPEEASIIWEETPPPEMWLPEIAAAAPAAPEPPAPPPASPEPGAAAPLAPVQAPMPAPAPSSFAKATEDKSSFARASEDTSEGKPEDASEDRPAAELPEIFVPVMPISSAAPEAGGAPPGFAEVSSFAMEDKSSSAGPVAEEPEDKSGGKPEPAFPPEPAPGPADSPAARMLPSESDFPEVLAARTRDDIAAAALAALSRRFGRAGFFVVRPTEVAGHSASGPGIDLEAFRAITIPWSEPSVFLNVRLSRAFYLGALPPLPRHRSLIDALGGSPEECLVQPVVMKDKPVAFLFVEFAHEQGASPMDLAYMRGLAAAAAASFAAAIRQRKREPV